MTLGHVAGEVGSTELPAIPALLRHALGGRLVSVGAIGCHAAVAAQIAGQGSDDV